MYLTRVNTEIETQWFPLFNWRNSLGMPGKARELTRFHKVLQIDVSIISYNCSPCYHLVILLTMGGKEKVSNCFHICINIRMIFSKRMRKT